MSSSMTLTETVYSSQSETPQHGCLTLLRLLFLCWRPTPRHTRRAHALRTKSVAYKLELLFNFWRYLLLQNQTDGNSRGFFRVVLNPWSAEEWLGLTCALKMFVRGASLPVEIGRLSSLEVFITSCTTVLNHWPRFTTAMWLKMKRMKNFCTLNTICVDKRMCLYFPDSYKRLLKEVDLPGDTWIWSKFAKICRWNGWHSWGSTEWYDIGKTYSLHGTNPPHGNCP